MTFFLRDDGNSFFDSGPAWSPDGTKIAFTSDRGGDDEIYVMNADGTGPTNLTNNDAFDFEPDWQTLTNDPPSCAGAAPSVGSLWPPNLQFVSSTIGGVVDPDGDSVTISITGVHQDEPVGITTPDAVIEGSSVLLRAERSGQGTGRVYTVSYLADDGNGGGCSGTVTVVVPLTDKGRSWTKGQSTIRRPDEPPSCLVDALREVKEQAFGSAGGRSVLARKSKIKRQTRRYPRNRKPRVNGNLPFSCHSFSGLWGDESE